MINVEHRSVFVAADAASEASRPDDDKTAANAAPETPISILVVEDEGIVAHDLKETLTRFGYRIVGIASEGAQAVSMAAKLRPELVVMDVGLRGEVDGVEAARLIQDSSQIPIIFLTGHSDTQTLHRAVLTGPLGYLIKPFQEAELHSTIEVAIHKHRADIATRRREEALRLDAERMQNLSLLDELTQLKNRRGFFELGRQALKVAKREQHALALFFMDLNGLKRINDTQGHLAGDQALRDAALVLRHTFRDSDILARIGGDEFVALAHVHATHASQDMNTLRSRLREQLREFNRTGGRPFDLDISIGMTSVEMPTEDLEALIARADAAMYEEKRATPQR